MLSTPVYSPFIKFPDLGLPVFFLFSGRFREKRKTGERLLDDIGPMPPVELHPRFGGQTLDIVWDNVCSSKMVNSVFSCAGRSCIEYPTVVAYRLSLLVPSTATNNTLLLLV